MTFLKEVEFQKEKKRRKRKQALQKKELFSYKNSDKLTTLITMQSTSQATHHRLAGNSYAQITDAPLEISLFCWLLSSDDHSSGEDSAIRKHLFKTVLLFMGAFLFVFFSRHLVVMFFSVGSVL